MTTRLFRRLRRGEMDERPVPMRVQGCSYGTRYPSRTQAKRARRQLREARDVWVASCRHCGGTHLMPTWLARERQREWDHQA